MGDRKPESSEKDGEGEDTTTVSPTAPPAGPEATTSGATSGDGVDNADAGDTKSSGTLKKGVRKQDIEPLLLKTTLDLHLFYGTAVTSADLTVGHKTYVGKADRLDVDQKHNSELLISLYRVIEHLETGESLRMYVLMGPDIMEKALCDFVQAHYQTKLLNATRGNAKGAWGGGAAHNSLYVITTQKGQFTQKGQSTKEESPSPLCKTGFPRHPLTKFLFGFVEDLKEHTVSVNRDLTDLESALDTPSSGGNLAVRLYMWWRELEQEERPRKLGERELKNARKQLDRLVEELDKRGVEMSWSADGRGPEGGGGGGGQ